MGLSVLSTARLSATNKKMAEIEQALMKFRSANNRLPCPADLTISQGSANYGVEAGAGACSAIGVGTGACTGTGMLPQADFTGAGAMNTFATAAEGAVPVATLGLPNDFMYDGWGNHFRYAVDISMTALSAFSNTPAGCTAGPITVNDVNAATRSTSAIYALISHGPNGHGAYTPNGVALSAGSVNASEQTNCHCNSSGTFTGYAPTYVQMVPSVDTSNALDNFDDLVTYQERWQMRTDWDSTTCQYLYVADSSNNRVQKFNTSGTFLMGIGAGYNGVIGSIGSSGTANGQLNGPFSLAIDSSGNLWVADNNNNRVEEFNSSGTWLASLGGTSSSLTA